MSRNWRRSRMHVCSALQHVWPRAGCAGSGGQPGGDNPGGTTRGVAQGLGRAGCSSLLWARVAGAGWRISNHVWFLQNDFETVWNRRFFNPLVRKSCLPARSSHVRSRLLPAFYICSFFFRMAGAHVPFLCRGTKSVYQVLVRSLKWSMFLSFASPSKLCISVRKMKNCRWNGWKFSPKQLKGKQKTQLKGSATRRASST